MQQDIRRSGATTIPEVLKCIAGLDLRRYSIADADIGIDGYNQPYDPRLLVLVNGRQVYRDEYEHIAWASIPVQLGEICQTEVIRGPNSALYCCNTADGTINDANITPRNVIILDVGLTWGKFDVDLYGRWQSSHIDFRSMVADKSIILEPVNVTHYVSLSGCIAYHLTPHVMLVLTAQQFSAANQLAAAGPAAERQFLILLTTHF